MARRGRGRLSAEDLALWRKTVASTTPLRLPETPEPGAPTPPARQPAMKIRPLARAEKAPAPAPGGMDRKKAARLRRGKLKIEARLDLHGMTLAEAHPALNGFIAGAARDGLRLLLVITGKGRGGDGVLKRQVPHWLRMAPLAGLVLEIAPAHARHGGEGALYVTLRRRR